MWLLAYEFSETIIIFDRTKKGKVIFLASKRKKALLDAMGMPDDYKGPELIVKLRDP